MATKDITSSFARSDDQVLETTNLNYPQGVLVTASSAADVILADTSPAFVGSGDPPNNFQITVELDHVANATTTPTFQLGATTSKVITRDTASALVVGDTGGSGNSIILKFSAATDTWDLLNPFKVNTSQYVADSVDQAAMGLLSVGTPELIDDSVTNAKIGPSAVGQTEIATDAVHQDEISETTQDLTVDPGGDGDATVQLSVSNSNFVFEPSLKLIDNGTALSTRIDNMIADTVETFFTRIYNIFLNASGGLNPTPGAIISNTRVDNSPPWDIDDGPIPFFLYAQINSEGRTIFVSSGANPPWEQSFFDNRFLKNKLTRKQLAEGFGVSEKDLGKKYKIERSIIDYETATYEDKLIEITPQIKNRLMAERPHPFMGMRVLKDGKDVDLGPLTTVLIDPCETGKLLELNKAGFCINDLILEKRLKITNDFMTNRKSPHPDIKIIPLKWK